MAALPEGLQSVSVLICRAQDKENVCVCVCACVCVLPVQEVRRQRPAICVSQFCLFPSFPPAALLARICITEVSSHTVSLIHTPRLSHCAVLYELFVFLFERPFAQLTQQYLRSNSLYTLIDKENDLQKDEVTVCVPIPTLEKVQYRKKKDKENHVESNEQIFECIMYCSSCLSRKVHCSRYGLRLKRLFLCCTLTCFALYMQTANFKGKI